MRSTRTVMQPKIHEEATFKIFRNTQVPEQSAINELIDNSLDAKATIIEVTYDKETISIKDNGFGMAPKTLAEAFDVGNHLNKEAKFGRFGYGLALCSLRFASTVEVITNNGEVQSKCSVVTKDYSKEVVIDSIPATGKTGTLIKLNGHSFRRRMAITKNLAFYYGPLIERGNLIIRVNGEELETEVSKDLILQEDRQTATVKWEGKKATITAGLLSEGLPMPVYNQMSGANFIYEGKIIESGVKDLFAFDKGSVSEIAFFVDLIDDKEKWELSSNKDEVKEKEEFFSSEILEPMVDRWIDRGKQKKTIIKMVELQGFVMAILGDVLGNKRRKRTKSLKDMERKGVAPEDKHNREDKEKEKKDIKDREHKKGGGFLFEYVTGGSLMRYEYSKKNKELKLILNYKAPIYQMLLENREAAKVYVMGVIANFLAEESSIDKDAIEKRFKGADFNTIFNTLNQSNVGINLVDYIKDDPSKLSFEERAVRIS